MAVLSFLDPEITGRKSFVMDVVDSTSGATGNGRLGNSGDVSRGGVSTSAGHQSKASISGASPGEACVEIMTPT
jgi:hypothetical protein